VFSRIERTDTEQVSARREVRERIVGVIALASVAVLLAWPLANPHLDAASAFFTPQTDRADIEQLRVTGEAGQVIRDGSWSVTRPASATAPAVGTPDPGTAQAIAYELVSAAGYSDTEYRCLHALWTRESGWNHFAQNPSSGAYGIPQALPAAKMASAGADWATNPETQIRWGLGYIDARYGSPCAAWEHSEQKNWY
jgi:hypothetical protein